MFLNGREVLRENIVSIDRTLLSRDSCVLFYKLQFCFLFCTKYAHTLKSAADVADVTQHKHMCAHSISTDFLSLCPF